MFAREAAGVDLTLRQIAILEAIRDGGTVIQSDIVQRTGIDRSTVTELMGRMDSRGLVSRERDARDARAYLVSVTDRGSAQLVEARRAAERASAAFIESLPENLRESFVRSLKIAAGVAQG